MKIRVGIIGGAGYTGGELIRILLHHSQVELVFVHSKSQAGRDLYDVHTDLFGDTDLKFASDLNQVVDVLFLCLRHGDSRLFLQKYKVTETVKIIDLSQDYRLRAHAENFVYGLPELNKAAISTADRIANPGCFATAVQLALLPLAKVGKLVNSIFVQAVTGSTGAGQKLGLTSHFSWRANNISVYKAFTHQHLNEIEQSLTQLQPGFEKHIKFIPERGDFTRGIFASVVLETNAGLEEVFKLYEAYYESHPFTHVSKSDIHLKQVVNTNKCLLSLTEHQGDLLITCAIDNLLKGASGQAVQNMNLMFGLEETTGLQLKASAF